MKKRVSDKFWFPFWVDKWIWGSMRIECTVEERAIWIDLLALATKDDGFIRANEDIPYPIEQLAGMLRIPKDRLQKSINKFVRIKKITKHQNKTLYITEWKKYQFTPRHKRRVMSDETDIESSGTDTIEKNRKEEDSKEKNKKKYSQTKLETLFEKWIKRYPRTEDEGKAKSLYFNLIEHERIDPQLLEDALTGYINVLNNNETPQQYVKYAKTFLYNGNKKKGIPSTWEPFVKYADPKYKATAPL